MLQIMGEAVGGQRTVVKLNHPQRYNCPIPLHFENLREGGEIGSRPLLPSYGASGIYH